MVDARGDVDLDGGLQAAGRGLGAGAAKGGRAPSVLLGLGLVSSRGILVVDLLLPREALGQLPRRRLCLLTLVVERIAVLQKLYQRLRPRPDVNAVVSPVRSLVLEVPQPPQDGVLVLDVLDDKPRAMLDHVLDDKERLVHLAPVLGLQR